MIRHEGGAISRRAVLAHSALASAAGLVGVAGLSGVTAAASCDVVVDGSGGGDHATIQGAVDAASPGDTICVRGGTYPESISVDKRVTVQGDGNPDGPDAAVVDGSVTVSADDATVSRLRIAPTTTFGAGGLDPHGILVTGSVSGVTVTGNVVAGLTADSTGGSVTINGIQVWNDGPERQTGTRITHNTVRGMHNMGDAAAGWPNYGGVAAVKVQGVVGDTVVAHNTVESVHSAGWTYGVVTTDTGNAPGVSPTNTTAEMNTVREVNDGSVYDVFDDPGSAPYPGSAFAIDGASRADEATATLNNVLETPIGAQNKDDAHTLDAECNYWGHASGPEAEDNPTGKGATVVGDVDYTSWNVRMVGHGKHPGNACVGGKNAGTGKKAGR